jgi:hypothetical protein
MPENVIAHTGSIAIGGNVINSTIQVITAGMGFVPRAYKQRIQEFMRAY